MALEFRKRRFHIPSKRTQYLLAFAALLLVLALVFCWAYIQHRLAEREQTASSDSTNSSTQELTFTDTDRGNLLCIVDGKQTDRFFLIQSDPAHNGIYLMPLPTTVMLDTQQTLGDIFDHGSAKKAAEAVADALELPLLHYMTITPANAKRWFVRFGDGIAVSLETAITHTGEDGTTIALTAGQQTVAANQSAALLTHSDATGATVITAMLNQYMRTGRNLSADFSALANLVQTDLRIGNFTEYRTALTHLAECNTGALCQTLTLPTNTKDGKTSINTRALKKLPLY